MQAPASRLLVFICAFNEEASVGQVISELREVLPDASVLLIDDGSTDNTASLARAAGAEVLSFSENRGLEQAIAEGYKQAFDQGFDICARIDADGQHDPRDLVDMISLVDSNACDVAIGSRFLPESTSYRPKVDRLVGTALLRGLIGIRLGRSVTDGTSGMYAANRFAMRLLAIPYQVGSPEVQGLLRLSDAELRIMEVPVSMRERLSGSSSFVGSRAFRLVVTVAGALILGEAYRRRRRARALN